MKIKLKENIFAREFLIEKLKHALDEIVIKKVFFTNAAPLPDFHPYFYTLSRIIWPLSGEKKIQFAKNGELTKEILRPGDIFFSEKDCWAHPEWDCIHTMLSIVYSNDNSYIRFLYIDNNTKRISSLPPDVWYHTAHGLEHAGSHLLESLNLLSRQMKADERPESLLLVKALLQMSYNVLDNDFPKISSKAQRTYMQIKHYVDANFNHKINRDTIADELQLNPSYISRLFRKKHGDSFNNYLTALRMERAVQMLEVGSATVNEVAWQCGYEDVGYFIKLFKQHFGVTPGNYSSNYRNDNI